MTDFCLIYTSSEGSGESVHCALKCDNCPIFRFSPPLKRAVKAQARLCIGMHVNSTEPSLLENAISTKFSVLSLVYASSECSGKTVH